MSVLLPAPFSPTRAWISPPRTPKVTPSLATTPGKAFVMPRTERRGAVAMIDVRVRILPVNGGRPRAPGTTLAREYSAAAGAPSAKNADADGASKRRPAAESGRARHGDGATDGGDRRRSAFTSPLLVTDSAPGDTAPSPWALTGRRGA